MSESNISWISCHLFYSHDKLDFILKKGVQPLVILLKNKGLIEKFFFIRYRKFGPHIRLRLKLHYPDNRDSVKQEIKVYFKNFFKEYPSYRPIPKNVANGKYFWYPNNSLQFIDYTQEIDRYGGKKGVLIAEDHFEYSSEIILYLLKEDAPKSYEQTISASLLINLSFSFGIGLDKVQAAQFFKLLYNLWMPLSFRMEGGFEVDNDLKKKLSERNIALFSESFEKERNKLLIIKEWWSKFQNNFELLPPKIQKWINDCGNINKKYKSTILNKDIKIPKRFKHEVSEHFSTEEIKGLDFNFWYIYQSLIHMNNNRTGLRNRDEPYVNYLIHMSLKN
ncbi:thiopeptide-type bacteriocin biosynthesis protein [soil metagenome]